MKGILFDLDGTLLDTEALSDKAILCAFGDSLPQHIREERHKEGDRLPWEIKKQILGRPGNEWIPMVIAYAQQHWGVAKEEGESSLPLPPSVDEMWNSWEANLNSFCSEIEALPGANELVEACAAVKIPMAIATSSRQAAVAKKRQRHERIFRHIKAVVCGDDPAVQQGKPEPDIYLEAARQLGVDPANCIVFEDATSGCKSGMAAGCRVIAVPDPRMEKSVFEGIAHVVLDSLADFDQSSLLLQPAALEN